MSAEKLWKKSMEDTPGDGMATDPGRAPLAQDYVISPGLTVSRCRRGRSLQQLHGNYGAELSPPPAT